MAKILIKNGRIWDGEKFFFSDILTDGELIVKIERNISDNADFVYDAMTREEAERLCDLSRMDIWFNYELREGDEFDLYKYSPDENTLCFCGIKHGESRSSFDLRLKFRIK
jgi:hypothetical protein